MHLKKADGTFATVVENSSFVVTSAHAGFGARPGVGPGDPIKMNNGPGETLLTGASLTSASSSANAAEANATVLRAETDIQGSVYEVHMKKVDGTYVMVKENAIFVVASIPSGVGTSPSQRPGGSHDWGPPGGTPGTTRARPCGAGSAAIRSSRPPEVLRGLIPL